MARNRQRRSSDQRKGKAPNSGPALLGAGALLAILVVWFAWQFTATLAPVRDGAPSWHPDSDRIVFYSEQPVGEHADGSPVFKADLFVVNLDGTRLQNLTNTPDVAEGAPAFSRNGLSLAFDADYDGNLDIYVRRLDQADNLRRVTRHPARDVAPAWHPTEDRLVFMSDRDAPGERFSLYTVDLSQDDPEPERLPIDDTSWFPQYSSDGSQIALHVRRDVHVFTPASGVLRRLTAEPLDGMYPSWSPHDERLAFMTERNGRMELFTMMADGSRQERLMTMPTGGAIDPRWSPDGRFIVFVHAVLASEDTMGGRLGPDEPDYEKQVIYVVEVDTGRVRRLSP